MLTRYVQPLTLMSNCLENTLKFVNMTFTRFQDTTRNDEVLKRLSLRGFSSRVPLRQLNIELTGP
jgi:ABC-type arginine transport system ATPase subunit